MKFPQLMSAFATAACLLVLPAAKAVPVPFTVTNASLTGGSGYGVDLDEKTGTLLTVNFSTSAFSAQTFGLTLAAPSKTFNFGSINFQEPNSHGGVTADEMNDLDVTASLTFTNPLGTLATVIATGTGTAGSVSDSAVDYSIHWAPTTVLFGNGG